VKRISHTCQSHRDIQSLLFVTCRERRSNDPNRQTIMIAVLARHLDEEFDDNSMTKAWNKRGQRPAGFAEQLRVDSAADLMDFIRTVARLRPTPQSPAYHGGHSRDRR
jgi:hypothetical protein